MNLRNLPWWQQSQHTTLQDWIRINLKSKDLINDIQWPTVFLTTVWTTWKERNKQVFENITQPPHTSVNFILNKALETQAAFQVFLHPNFKEPSLMSWSCPLAGKLKMNTDGNSRGDPRQSGYGGLLRDEVGTWIWGFYGYLGNCSSLEAELWGIYWGLTIILQKGLANIQIETDSQLAMELIRGGAGENSPYRALIEDANFLLRGCQCTIETIPREANQCADALANLGVNQQEHLILKEDPPVSILSLLTADLLHVGSRRD